MCEVCDKRDLAAADINLKNAEAVALLVDSAIQLDSQNLTTARDRVLKALYEILPEDVKAEPAVIPTEAGVSDAAPVTPEAATKPETLFVPGIGDVPRDKVIEILAKRLGVDPRTIRLV